MIAIAVEIVFAFSLAASSAWLIRSRGGKAPASRILLLGGLAGLVFALAWLERLGQLDDEDAQVLQQIETATGYPVFNMPKLDEYYIGLRLDAAAAR